MTTPHEAPAPTLRMLLDPYWADLDGSYYAVSNEQLDEIETVLTEPLRAENDALRARLAKADAVPASSAGALDISSGHTTPALDTSSGHRDEALDIADSSAGEEVETSGEKGYADGHALGVREVLRNISSLLESWLPGAPPAVADAGSMDGTNMTRLQLDSHGKFIEILALKNREQDEQIGALRRDVGAQDEVIEHWRQEVGSLGRAIESWGQRIIALEQPSAPVVPVTDAMARAAWFEAWPRFPPTEFNIREMKRLVTAALAAKESEATK